MKKLIWLDDMRCPFYNPWTDLIKRLFGDVRVVWAQSYEEFIASVDMAMPDIVCFDHDLGTEKSGADAARHLCNMCMEQGIDAPVYYIQSSNPVGRENITSIIESYHKVYISK